MNEQALVAALRQIAEFEVERPIDEWAEAEAFGECQKIARETLKKLGYDNV